MNKNLIIYTINNGYGGCYSDYVTDEELKIKFKYYKNFMIDFEIYDVSERFFMNLPINIRSYNKDWTSLNIKEVSKIINLKLRQEKILKLIKKIKLNLY